MKKNDTYFILPEITSNKDLYGTASVNAFELSKLKLAIRFSLALNNLKSNKFWQNLFISRIPNHKGDYPFYILLDNKDIQYLTSSTYLF
ncbi:hypothetical protein CS542_07435 [Pedobacter sp. IW39]|nr:hypothetical protein CS542_07435 [Pedobacter sp. IW39]